MVPPRALPAKIRAAIFDLDDTLVESTVDYAKFKRLVIDRIVSDREDRSKYDPSETIVAIVDRYEESLRRRGFSEGEIRARLVALDKIMDQVELERVAETKPLRGARELLSFLRAKGVKVGILTRGCKEYAHRALSAAGLLEMVDALECRSSEVKAKPDPGQYLGLVRALGVRKDESVFVGDHPIDAQCAANAGVAFLAVGTGEIPEEIMRQAGAMEYFEDLEGLAEWFRRVIR